MVEHQTDASSADDLLVLDDEPAAEGAPAHGAAEAHWSVLIVDDDETVQQATALALAGVEIEGRPLRLVHARSGAEGLAVAQREAGVAVALVDVVMEDPHAGLHLVGELRGLPGREALRIVLRTGQAGQAPELETVRDHDVDGYFTKTELTRNRLLVVLMTSIRAHRRITEIEEQRNHLARLASELQQARAAEREAYGEKLGAERELRQVHETMEACIEQRTQELSGAFAELDAFTRRVAHDLRGPLMGMTDLSSLIQKRLQGGDMAQVSRWVGMLESQTRQLGDLVSGLLDLSRATRGHADMSVVPLADLVEQARQTLLLTAEPNREVQVDIGPLPTLSCDPLLMRQVLVNLIGNAMKFTRKVPAPRVEVRAERVQTASAAPAWEIQVRDNGVGFDAGRAASLFQPFSRLHGGVYEGSGIGLTIVQRIVQLHGGTVTARSEPGQGAVFSLVMPG